MLDPHSGSEYGAARIAAMIAATITIILTGLVSFGFMVPYAQADSFGTLTINAVWNRDAASPKSLAGDTYAIVRVATVTTNSNGSVSSYKTVSDFSGLTADWERLTSSEYHDAAKKLATHAAKNKLYQHAGTTNVAGQLTFQNLPLGLGVLDRPAQQRQHHPHDPLRGLSVVLAQAAEIAGETGDHGRCGQSSHLLCAAHRADHRLDERIRADPL